MQGQITSHARAPIRPDNCASQEHSNALENRVVFVVPLAARVLVVPLSVALVAVALFPMRVVLRELPITQVFSEILEPPPR